MEKTWSITSTESIMDYIVDMILRANKSIYLIIPELSMLKLDYFKNIEPNVLVHIFTSLDPTKDSQLLNDFLTSRNIRIWQTNTKYSVYCVFKDGVEMIFAPFNENEKEIVGFVTEQKEYLNVFQKILGPFFETISSENKPLKKKVQVEEPLKPQMDLKKGPSVQEPPKPQKDSKKVTPAEGVGKPKRESKKGSQ
jgi:sugar-specific transcriptional regulator TrmB